jgi:hypothetical protein
LVWFTGKSPEGVQLVVRVWKYPFCLPYLDTLNTKCGFLSFYPKHYIESFLKYLRELPFGNIFAVTKVEHPTYNGDFIF